MKKILYNALHHTTGGIIHGACRREVGLGVHRDVLPATGNLLLVSDFALVGLQHRHGLFNLALERGIILQHVHQI